ncbi:MAG: hypothetical protein A2430_00665 [Candidatus Liptonbacteria bacterium RIFOXYC1_FULL_36_8]|uniref:Amino acid transporter transmembrane domain-containing protein n=3 Tax=Candidatus Liptoniibacteriota TaxID=1817909 RepID=A0A1G2CLE0_9BACT|nr:MAG: hypothetical protein A2390_00845 [Candidatus Liptonbacteria bacterium RIFOXYB1_FULL_36_10]OGZ02963.1 MAG: hypothetical protein A2430_00665 [Candidatus Liptonbacteria bacterium RIFOXYC1_FULL_36_8]OGZ03570.1 MAG: hypothetical protein A2604_00215 [Candidatus Liptonbacteria bacterium RIFOXYD1_FULL_36_11]
MKYLKLSFYKKFVLPVSLLASTIIGAGVFSLPYFVSLAGFITGVFYIATSVLIFYFLHTMYADIILRNREKFKFAGYAEKYFGKIGFWLSIGAAIVGGVMTLMVYLILAESFLKIIFPEGEEKIFILLFWVLGSAAIFLSIKKMARFEFAITTVMAILFFFIFSMGFTNEVKKIIEIPSVNWALFFLPFGPFLFSFSGRAAVPALIEYYKENKISFVGFKKVIFWGTVVPAVAYLAFIIGALKMGGGLMENPLAWITTLPYFVSALISLTGLLSILSSYFVIGLSIKEIMEMDLNIKTRVADIAVIFLPVFLICLGFNNFFRIVSIAGGVFLALEGAIISAVWIKMEKKGMVPYLFARRGVNLAAAIFLFVIFVLGIVYSAIYY